MTYVHRWYAAAVCFALAGVTRPAVAQTPDLGVCQPLAARAADTWLRGMPWDSAGAVADAAKCGTADRAAGTVARALVAIFGERHEDALRELAPLLRAAAPPPAARYVECLALDVLGRYEDAVAACDAALARRPGWLVPELPRGRALAELGRLEDAVAALRRGLRAVPQSYSDWNLLAKLESYRGRRSEAIAAYEEAFRATPVSLTWWRATIASNLAQFAADSLQQHDRAVQVLADVLRTDSTNTSVLLRRGYIELGRGRRGEARLQADRALRFEPRNAAALILRGSLRTDEGDRTGAEADFRLASADTSESGSIALFRIAGLRRDAGRGTEAENTVVEALLRRPSDGRFFAVVPEIVKDSARQLDVYNRVLARVPSRPARLGRLSMPDRILSPMRKLDDAAFLAADTVTQDADSWFVLERHAELLAQVGRLPEAVRAFGRMGVAAPTMLDELESRRARSIALGARALLRTELGDIPGGTNDLRQAEVAQVAFYEAEGDSVLAYGKPAPLLRLPGSAVMRDAEASAGRTATAVGLALLRRGELEGFTWLMRGQPDSASLEQFAGIVQQRGLSLRDLALRLPPAPADAEGVRFRVQVSLGNAVEIVTAPRATGAPRQYFQTQGALEQDVPWEATAFAPRRPAAAVRWWHLHAGARYLQRAALLQRNAEIFLLASQRKRTGDGRAVQLAGDIRDPEGERWMLQAYGMTRGVSSGWCSPSTGVALTFRVGYRNLGEEGGVEVIVRERGESYPTTYATVHFDPQTNRLRAEHPGKPTLILEPSGVPGQGGAFVHPRLGTLRASGCKPK